MTFEHLLPALDEDEFDYGLGAVANSESGSDDFGPDSSPGLSLKSPRAGREAVTIIVESEGEGSHQSSSSPITHQSFISQSDNE